jgi:hypothetical protein
LVTILPSDPNSGQALSIAVPATGPTAAFDLQIPYSQAGTTPVPSLTLSVQPWTGGLRNYPAILLPFSGQIVDAGEPTLHLVAVDGGPLNLALPYDDSIGMLTLGGYTQSPVDGGTLLMGAAVQVSSLSLSNCAPDAGSCVFQQSTVSDQGTAAWSINAPPGIYEVTIIPQYPDSYELFPATTERDCTTDVCSSFIDPKAARGFAISGWVVRPNSQPFDGEGQAAIFSLPDMRLLSMTRLAPDGGFSVDAPVGRATLIITPDEVTGYPSTWMTLDIDSPRIPFQVMLSQPGLLTGTVSLEAVDGGTSLPVSNATVLFYYVASDVNDPDGGEVAFPVANGVTDSLGNFSVVGLTVIQPNQ